VAVVLVGVLAVLLVVSGGGSPADRTEAQAVVDEVVRDAFPEFAGKKDRVEEFTGADGTSYTVVSYSDVVEVQAGDKVVDVPRVLIIQVAEGSEEVIVVQSP
jgi:hypothetical protein